MGDSFPGRPKALSLAGQAVGQSPALRQRHLGDELPEFRPFRPWSMIVIARGSTALDEADADLGIVFRYETEYGMP
jgi:hypothetical protein